MKNTLICAKNVVNISPHNILLKSFERLLATFRLQNRCEKPKKGRAKKDAARAASRFKYVEKLCPRKKKHARSSGLQAPS